jgi:hypothetical protein
MERQINYEALLKEIIEISEREGFVKSNEATPVLLEIKENPLIFSIKEQREIPLENHHSMCLTTDSFRISKTFRNEDRERSFKRFFYYFLAYIFEQITIESKIHTLKLFGYDVNKKPS